MANTLNTFMLSFCLGLPAAGLCAAEQPLQMQASGPLKREMFIQDWIKLNKSSFTQMSVGSYDPDRNFLDKNFVLQLARQGLTVNDAEMQRLDRLTMQTMAYQKIISLKRHQIKLDQELLQKIIAQSDSPRPQHISTAETFNAGLKVSVLEQEYEIKILKYFLKTTQLAAQQGQRPFGIELATFRDWINYKLMQHQLHKVPKPPFDAKKTLRDAAFFSGQDSISAYQRLKPETPTFKTLVHLQIQHLRQNDQLFEATSPPARNLQEASKKLTKLGEVLKSADYQHHIEAGQEIARQEKLIDYEILNGLDKYFFK